jgi:hypothetical protein
MSLHIDLQDGFENDEVIVRVDGREVFHKDGVSTDIRISRADGLETPTAKPEVTVEIELPKRKLKASQRLKVSDSGYLGASRDGNSLRLRTSKEAFLYM